jgi:uncharacterized protein YwgA
MPELTARQRLLTSIFDHLGTFSMKTLRDRIVVQKTVYFLQQSGAYLGYNYSWYVYGPYSPSLAKDAFAIWASAKASSTGHVGGPKLEQVVEKLKEFLGDRRKDAVWLEALGSLHMLSRLYPNESRSDLIQRVLNKGPYFVKSDCEKAWEHLVEHGLVVDRL